jgi:hypothetical protein
MKWLLAFLGVLLLELLCVSPVLATDITITAIPYVLFPTVTSTAATEVTDTSAILHGEIVDLGSGNATIRGFQWGYSPGTYTHNWTEAGSFGLGTFAHTATNLTTEVWVYWRAFATNPNGTGYSPERSFYTTGLPLAPTDFTITQVGDTIISLSWTMGIRASTTIIRGSSSGYPSSITDGYLVYSGNATSTTIDGLNLQTAIYYYRAWSSNEHGNSAGYDEGYAGATISIMAIIFVIALCAFAFWQRDWIRVILAVCIVIWGAFALAYDVKIAAPLLAIGVVLFIMGIMKVMKAQKEGEG